MATDSFYARWPAPSGGSLNHPTWFCVGSGSRGVDDRGGHWHLAGDGSILVAVTAATDGQPGTSYREHEQILLLAAYAAGLHHLHDIVPLPATDGRDTFTYATAHDPTAADRESDADTPRQTTHTTLVIFGHPDRRP